MLTTTCRGPIVRALRTATLVLAAALLGAPLAACALPASESAATPAPATAATAREARPLRLDFAQVDLRVLLGIVADAAGKTLRLAPGIGGTVEAHYAAPWNQVLAQIAQRHGLKAVVQGNEIRVSKAPA
ncbi:hypothetical protein [Rhizobacter sp. P5_C2]